MLYHLLYALRGELSLLNVTRYITFRTAVASLTALLIVLFLGPWMIERLRRLQIGQLIGRSVEPRAQLTGQPARQLTEPRMNALDRKLSARVRTVALEDGAARLALVESHLCGELDEQLSLIHI